MRYAVAALLVVAALLGLRIAGGPAAQAHAALERSEPAQGAVLPASPSRVLLVFTEPIELGLTDITLRGAQGTVVGDPVLSPSGRTGVEFPVPTLPNGSYVVVIRVVSAVDGHATTASVSFSVGEPGAALDIDTGGAGGPPRTAQWAGKFVTFLGLAALWGLVVPTPTARPRTRGGRVAATVAGVLLLGALLSLAIQSWTAAGSLSGIDGDTLRSLLDTRFGHIWWFRLAGSIAAFGLLWFGGRLPRAAGTPLGAALALGLCLTISLNAHLAAHEGRGFLPELTDWLHFSAATAWAGGVAALALRTRRGAAADPAELGKFTLLAAPAVVALAATGVIAWLWLTPGWSALWETGYGRLVLLKIALFVPMLVLGGAHLRGGRGRRIPGPHALSRPAATLLAESVLGIAVLAVAALLSSTPPPAKTVSAAPPSVTVEARNGSVSGTLTAEPGRAGENTLVVRISGTEVAEVTLRVSLPGAGIEPLTTTTLADRDGSYITPPLLLPLTGEWEAVATVTPKSGVQRDLRFLITLGQ